MNTLELFTHLKKDPYCMKYFSSIYARNELPTIFPKLPSAFVFNTENRNLPGEHWLSIFIDEFRNVEFFDPAGMHPSFYGLDAYINSICNTWIRNKHRIQSNYSYLCGQFCLFYLFFRCRYFSLDYIQSNFTQDFETNEKILLKFLNQIFINN